MEERSTHTQKRHIPTKTKQKQKQNKKKRHHDCRITTITTDRQGTRPLLTFCHLNGQRKRTQKSVRPVASCQAATLIKTNKKNKCHRSDGRAVISLSTPANPINERRCEALTPLYSKRNRWSVYRHTIPTFFVSSSRKSRKGL